MTNKEKQVILKFCRELEQIKNDTDNFNLALLKLKYYSNYCQLNKQLQRLRKLNYENENFQKQSLRWESLIIRGIKRCFEKYNQ